METRDVLLKADKVAVVFERIADGKIRVTTSSWVRPYDQVGTCLATADEIPHRLLKGVLAEALFVARPSGQPLCVDRSCENEAPSTPTRRSRAADHHNDACRLRICEPAVLRS